MSTIASLPTTTSTFWPLVYRFAWKEVRKMRGFTLGVAGLTALAMAIIVFMSQPAYIENVRAILLLICAFGGGAFVAIGAATTAFSVEREEQTDTFLLTLPRYWQALFAGKLLAVCFLALAFALGMSAVAWILGGFGFPSKGGFPLYLKLGTVLLAEATVWGLVVSLLVRRPLLAAVLACAATSFASQFAIALADRPGYQGQAFVDSLGYRWLLCGVGLVIAMLLAHRWVNRTESVHSQRRGRRSQFTEAIPATVRRTIAASAVTNLQPLGATTHRSIFWRIVWQTWRESWPVMLGAIGVGVLLMVSLELLVPELRGQRGVVSPISFLGTFFIPGLCGALAFRQDHRRGQHQFLTEHAGRPQLVWLARLFTWGTYLTVLFLVIVAIAAWVFVSRFGFQEPTVSSGPWGNIHMAERQVFWNDFFYRGVPMAIFATFLAFALGQLASLVLKSEILAAGLSLFASIGVMLYCQLIWFWQLPPVWCLLPIAVGAFAATYLRIGDWLAARSTPKSWSRVAAAALVPVLVVVASLPMIRHSQIEWALNTIALDEHHRLHRAGVGMGPVDMEVSRQQLDQRFDAAVTEFEEQQRAAELVTMEYKALLQEIRETTMVASALNQEVGADDPTLDVEERLRAEFRGITPARLQRLIELTEEPVADNRYPENWIREVAWILDDSARKAMSAGDLDLAWTRILALENFRRQLQSDPMARQTSFQRGTDDISRMFGDDLLVLWALSPGQTPERIRDAVATLIEISHQYPPLQSDVIADYVDARAILNGGSPANSLASTPPISEIALFLDRFPGEHWRAELALRVFAMQTLQYIHAKGPTSTPHWGYVHDVSLAVGYRTPVDTTWRLQLWKTAASSLLADEIWNSRTISRSDVEDKTRNLTDRRLELLRLLLIAHHLEHGVYPIALDLLLPIHDKAQFAEVLIDPFSGQPFQYAPRYFERATWGDELWDEFSRITDYAAPLIWSTSGSNYGKYQFPIDLRRSLPAELHSQLKGQHLLEGFDRIESYHLYLEADQVDDSVSAHWDDWTRVRSLPNANEYPNYEPPTPESEATSPESD